MIANAGKYLTGQLDGYKLPNDSILATKGVSKEEAIAYFYDKLGVTQQVDFLANGSATMSPTEAFSLARDTNSVDAIAHAYPTIAGVSYDTDFFGTSLVSGNISIGASHGIAETIVEPTPDKKLIHEETGVEVILSGQDATNID